MPVTSNHPNWIGQDRSFSVQTHDNTSPPAVPRAQGASKLLRGLLRYSCRAYPLLSGCTRLANMWPLRALTSAPESIVGRLRDRSLIRLELDDYGGRTMYYFGDYDPKITWILRRLLRAGDQVVDAGANFGLISLMAANLVGPAGCVHAFEPQRHLASMLTESAQLNGYGWLQVHSMALSDRDGEMELFTCPGVTGAASLETAATTDAMTTSVTVAHANDYLNQLELGKVRLLKLDIEGHELTVLSCAEPWLRENQPDAVLFETRDGSASLREQPVVRLLERLQYDVYPVPKSWLGLRFQRLDQLPKNPSVQAHDALAIHRTASLTL